MSTLAMTALVLLLAQPASKVRDGIVPTKLTLEDVVKNVQKNEELYRTFEMRVREDYKLVDPERERSFGGKEGISTVRSTTLVHVIQDGERFYQKEERSSFLENSKEPQLYKIVTAYDGNQTRTIGGDPVYARIQDGRERPNRFWHPNSLLTRQFHVPIPLSKYLTMPDTASHDNRWTVLGEEKVDELRCVKLKFEMAHKDVEHVEKTGTTSYFEAYLWLAMDRNYLPIRSVSVTPRLHPTLDHGIGQVTSLKEVKPGIWVPERADYVAHDATELKRGMMIPDRQRDFQVQEIILGKTYDVEVFRPEIPAGAKIHK